MATLKPTVSAVTIDQVSKDCRLRQSRKVVAALRRFWDLMVLESETAGGPDGVVTRECESPPLPEARAAFPGTSHPRCLRRALCVVCRLHDDAPEGLEGAPCRL